MRQGWRELDNKRRVGQRPASKVLGRRALCERLFGVANIAVLLEGWWPPEHFLPNITFFCKTLAWFYVMVWWLFAPHFRWNVKFWLVWNWMNIHELNWPRGLRGDPYTITTNTQPNGNTFRANTFASTCAYHVCITIIVSLSRHPTTDPVLGGQSLEDWRVRPIPQAEEEPWLNLLWRRPRGVLQVVSQKCISVRSHREGVELGELRWEGLFLAGKGQQDLLHFSLGGFHFISQPKSSL